MKIDLPESIINQTIATGIVSPSGVQVRCSYCDKYHTIVYSNPENIDPYNEDYATTYFGIVCHGCGNVVYVQF